MGAAHASVPPIFREVLLQDVRQTTTGVKGLRVAFCSEKEVFGEEKSYIGERGGALVETTTFNRRVVGSTPTLAAT